MKYSIFGIRKNYAAKKKLHFMFFWGHSETGSETTTACLSQWYPCRFIADDFTYNTAEQYMMAQKALLFGDKNAFEKIMAARSPKQYKAIGREIKNFSDDLWDEKKYTIVLEGNMAKFSQNPELKAFLVGTGKKVLVEASPYDKVWGIGMSADESSAKNPLLWKGENLLGFALMEVRDTLQTK